MGGSSTSSSPSSSATALDVALFVDIRRTSSSPLSSATVVAGLEGELGADLMGVVSRAGNSRRGSAISSLVFLSRLQMEGAPSGLSGFWELSIVAG